MNRDETTGTVQTEADRVTDALQTMIHGAIDGELGPTRQKLDELESALGRRVSELRDETRAALERLKSQADESRAAADRQAGELGSRIEAVANEARELGSRIENLSSELREAVERHGRELGSRIDAAEQRGIEAAQRLEGEVRPQLGELNRQSAAAEQRHTEAAEEHGRRLDELQRDIAKRLESFRGEIEGRLDDARQVLEQELSQKTDRLQSDVKVAADRAERTHAELEEHVLVADKMAEMLESMTQIFSRPGAVHARSPAVVSQAAPITRAPEVQAPPTTPGVRLPHDTDRESTPVVRSAEPAPASPETIPNFAGSTPEAAGCRKAVDDALEKMFSDED